MSRRTTSDWHALDPIDRAWSGIAFTRAVTGIDVPEPEYLRDALLDLVTIAPELGRWTRDSPPGWRPVAPGELSTWLDRTLITSGEAGVSTQRALELSLGPLGDLPLRMTAGPDWLSLRLSHTIGDAWTADSLIGHLLRQAASPEVLARSWHVVSPRRRDAMLAHDVSRRLPAVAHALRRRQDLAGGEYEPANVIADLLVDHTAVISDADFPATVRALRDELFPATSVAALILTGVRAALAGELPPSRPGFECLFTTRSTARRTADAWGNWSAGVYLHPTDDLNPVAVSAEMTRTRASGLPELAHASLRARARRSDHTTITMPRAVGAPRLTMSYTRHRDGPATMPGLRPDSEFGMWTRPNGTESITIHATECGGRLTTGVSFFPDVWPADVVCGAVGRFLRDPEPMLRTLPGALR